MMRKFKLSAAQMQPLAMGHGACLATDLITVEGQPVQWMYREAPCNEVDSGWRFFSGLETQTYVDDPDNTTFYDINDIANYDPSIIPSLSAPIGSAFEKIDGAFVAVEFTPSDD